MEKINSRFNKEKKIRGTLLPNVIYYDCPENGRRRDFMNDDDENRKKTDYYLTVSFLWVSCYFHFLFYPLNGPNPSLFIIRILIIDFNYHIPIQFLLILEAILYFVTIFNFYIKLKNI